MDRTLLTKARPYQLDAHADEIFDLVAGRGWKLKDVQEHFIARYNLYATTNMWKKRFKKMGLNIKYHRRAVMDQAAQHYQICLDTGETFRYEVGGHRTIDSEELWRYAGRLGLTIVDGRFVRPSMQQAPNGWQQGEARSVPVAVSNQPLESNEERNLTDVDDSLGHIDDMELCFDTACPEECTSSLPVARSDNQPLLLAATYENHENITEQQTAQRVGPSIPTCCAASSDCSIAPIATITKVQSFLTECGNARRHQISPPDVHSHHETLLWTIDISVAVSFDSGHSKLGESGWLLVNEHVQTAVARASALQSLFRSAMKLSAAVKMKKAWRSFCIGLSYLFFSLNYCLPEGLSEFLNVCLFFSANHHTHTVRLIASYASEWCRRTNNGSHLQKFFATISDIEESCLFNVLVQAGKVLYFQERRVADGNHPAICVDYCRILNWEYKNDPEQLKCEYATIVAKMKSDANDSFNITVANMMILQQLVEMGEYSNAAAIARETLEILAPEEKPPLFSDPWVLIYELAGILACCLWKMGDRHSGLEWIEFAMEAADNSGSDRSNARRELSLVCSTMHGELGNVSAAKRYARIAEHRFRGMELRVDRLEERFRNFSVDEWRDHGNEAVSTPDESGEEKRVEKEDATSSDSALRSTWKPGVTSSEQSVVLASLYHSD